MNTAMQELRNDISIEMKLGYISEHSANRILDYINNLYLEKEKEQIKTAFENGWRRNFSSEKYYEETYNQNK